MAFFKLRNKSGDEHSNSASAVESVEAIRTRARQRLIGATILVLVGVIGFPLLFESQPRPVPIDIAIEIPDKNQVKPLVLPGPDTARDEVAAGTPTPVPPPASADEPTPAPPKPKVVDTPASKVTPPTGANTSTSKPAPAKDSVKTAEKPAPSTKSTAKHNTGAKAQALLDGKKSEATASPNGRFVVQVGAYSDVLKAREVRVKLAKAKLKTYTQVITSSEGRRIRVRVGPFATKAQAEKTAEKIKKLGLPGSVLEL